MDDELLAGEAPLVGVMEAGVGEGGLDALAVDGKRRLVGVLLDDGEQVGEQPLLGGREVGALGRQFGRRRDLGQPVDLPPLAGEDGRRPVGGGRRLLLAGFARLGVGRLITAADRPQAPARSFTLLRYRLPSSYRCA
jgi:hypothetical protein